MSETKEEYVTGEAPAEDQVTGPVPVVIITVDLMTGEKRIVAGPGVNAVLVMLEALAAVEKARQEELNARAKIVLAKGPLARVRR